MTIASMHFRTAVVAAAMAVSATGASALTLNFANKQANSVQTFSSEVQAQLRQIQIKVTPAGNASAVTGVAGAYNLPITSITVGSNLKIASGSAIGSALRFDRIVDDEETGEAVPLAVTLANFTIDYTKNLVLADATPKGGATITKLPIYTFKVNEALKLKFVFPFTITGNEQLNNLFLTPEAQAFLIKELQLPGFVTELLKTTDFGTITNNVSTRARTPAVPTAPYVAN